MKKAKGFSVFCLSLCLLLNFPVDSGGGGGGCGSPSNYVVGNIHSNSNYTIGIDSGHSNLNIAGTISAVGTATVGSGVNATSTQSGASYIDIPRINFAGLKAANGQTIGSTQIMYTDGDVSINLTDCAAYQNKTVVASGNITVVRSMGSHQGLTDLTANLIARGSIDIDINGCSAGEGGITGLIYSLGEKPISIGHHSKGNFTGINIDLSGCGHSIRSVHGIIMAKNGSFRLDIHGGGDGDSGVERDASVTNDLINFFEYMTCWREIGG